MAEPDDVHQPPIRDLQGGDDRKGEEGQGHEGVLERRAETVRGAHEAIHRTAHRAHRFGGHQPGDRQRQARRNRAAGRDRQPAAHLHHGGGRHGHVRVRDTGHDEVVRIVCDAGGDGPAPQAQAAHQPDPGAPAAGVSLHDRDLEQVAAGVGRQPPTGNRHGHSQQPGDDLIRDDVDHPGRAATDRV